MCSFCCVLCEFADSNPKCINLHCLKSGQIDSKTAADAGNSDPDKLREKAAELESLSAEELLKRQMEIKVKWLLHSSWKFVHPSLEFTLIYEFP